ncbi:hypothetical protein WH5701_12343 [Synechococcus sp. WH 5701]|nr:hypothetical protein WH5701_12343 [Synechococcus sp. WH 5701]
MTVSVATSIGGQPSVSAIGQLTRQWAAHPDLLAAKRAGLRRLWQRYFPDTFITDILELLDGIRE